MNESNLNSQKQLFRRKLSLPRLGFVLLVTALVIGGGYFGVRRVVANLSAGTYTPWYAPYVDVTATPTFAFPPAELVAESVFLLAVPDRSVPKEFATIEEPDYPVRHLASTTLPHRYCDAKLLSYQLSKPRRLTKFGRGWLRDCPA